jgi:Type IV secretory system Conjugative DNA transfer
VGGPFDISKELGIIKSAAGWSRWGWKAGRHWKASRVRKQIEEQYDAETAEAVAAAIASGRNPQPILERAERRKAESAEREKLLTNPPPLHRSAAWATAKDLSRFLKGRDSFDTQSSILLGTFLEDGAQDPAGFVHWDGDGHLLTLAPTRSGKSVTTIIPNLLRYRGSAVVLDPKGELYEATSAWRAANVGPVYRIAPFDDGSDPTTQGFPKHGLNPLARIRSQHQARGQAQLMFPRDPNGQEFFNDDAVSFLTGLILYVLDSAPEHRRNLGTVREATAASLDRFKHLVTLMAGSRLPGVREAANTVLGKSGDRGLPNLRDTLHSKLSLWSDPALLEVTDRNDVDFARLKDHQATVYITVPLNLLEPYAPFVKVLLKAALDAMLDHPAVHPGRVSVARPVRGFPQCHRHPCLSGRPALVLPAGHGDPRRALPGHGLARIPEHLGQTVLWHRRPLHGRIGRPLPRQPNRRLPQHPDRRERFRANGELAGGWFGGGQPLNWRKHPISRPAFDDARRSDGAAFGLARQWRPNRDRPHPGTARVQSSTGALRQERELPRAIRSI